MKKVFLVLVMMMFCNSATATDKTQLEQIKLYQDELNNCQAIKENEFQNKCPTIGYDETSCSYTYSTDIKINLNKSELLCYQNIADKIFSVFYSNIYETRVKVFNEYVDTSKKLFLETYVDIDICNQNTCGNFEYLIAYENLNFYIYQYLHDTIKFIKQKYEF